MIPILFDRYETEFTANGLGRLADCLSCKVTEERNGIYECEFTYPVTGEMYSEIQEGRIIGVIHDDAKDIQPFDIYARTAPLDGVVTFFAHHISYRLGNVILKPMTAASCADALTAIPNNTYNHCPFTFWTDKAVSGNWKNDVPSAVKAILGGQQGSILDVYGKGEYEFDKWLVRLYVNRGVNNGVSIRYGVNLTDLHQQRDDSGMYNAVAPFWKSESDGTVVTLPEGYILSGQGEVIYEPWTDENGVEITDEDGEPFEFTSFVEIIVPMDLSSVFQEEPTVEQLRTEAMRRMNNSESWLPSENITVKFVDLAHTEEYKNVAVLQRVRLCDRVSVYCGPLGVNAVSMQVIRVVYNVLTERYDEIELGKAKVTFAETVMANVSEALNDLPTTAQVKSITESAINNATQQIIGAQNSHVKFVYDANGGLQEILILDTDDIETAENVWRFNAGGIGHSSNGYAGPYSVAMTMDGQIVADMITTGILNASLLKAGIIDGDLIYVKLLKILNDNGDMVAQFNDEIRIGMLDKAYALFDFNSMSLYDRNDVKYMDIGDNRTISGIGTYENYFTGDGSTTEFYLYTYKPYSLNPIKEVTVQGLSTTDYEYIGYNVGYEKIVFNHAPLKDAPIVVKFLSADPQYHYDFGTRKANTIIGKYSMINGVNLEASGSRSHAEGYGSIASEYTSHAEGYSTRALGTSSHSEGNETSANSSKYGYASHAEGSETYANGYYCHAEGENSKTQTIDAVDGTYYSYCCHAEGRGTEANGIGCHSEGGYTKAEGSFNHAEGYHTIAKKKYSHAEGYGTISAALGQHASGWYNVENDTIHGQGLMLEIIGNGTGESNRSNARYLRENGNEWIAGTLTQASDARLKTECGDIPDVTGIKARLFKWNEKKINHDDKIHIGYFAQDVEEVAPYLVDIDENGNKSLDYIAFLCAKVTCLERRIAELEKGVDK